MEICKFINRTTQLAVWLPCIPAVIEQQINQSLLDTERKSGMHGDWWSKDEFVLMCCDLLNNEEDNMHSVLLAS